MTLSEAEIFDPQESAPIEHRAAKPISEMHTNVPIYGRNSGYLRIKYTIDWVVALLALVVLSPFLLAIGVLIRLDSKGPALFRQRRVGFDNRSFTCYKFRTMQVGSHRNGDRESAITQQGDPRITRIGRVLRRMRLDELPQLLNILRGEMSWIGPRPEAVELSHWYEEHLPSYNQRFRVRPGITGLAQIRQGHVAGIDATSVKLAFDLDYAKNVSFRRDLGIAFATLRIMATGHGAK